MRKTGFVRSAIPPVPSLRTGPGRSWKRAYPFSTIQVGESCFVSNRWLSEQQLNHRAFHSSVSYYARQHQRKYSLRKGEGGIWVLRVA